MIWTVVAHNMISRKQVLDDPEHLLNVCDEASNWISVVMGPYTRLGGSRVVASRQRERNQLHEFILSTERNYDVLPAIQFIGHGRAGDSPAEWHRT